MEAAVLTEKSKIVITEIEKPIPEPEEVLIQTKAVGICGTDLSIYRGEWPVKLPMVMGHEAAGIIAKVGSSVDTFEKDERAVVEPGLSCGECWFCRRGSYYHCENIKYIGINAGKGAFAEYFTAPAAKCYRIPQNMSWEEAAFFEPLGCALHATDLFPDTWGESVAVLGPGVAGLCFVQLAKLRGAQKVILTGTRSERLSLGEKLGADVAINIKKDKDVIERILRETNGRGVDQTIVACAAGQAVRDAISITRRQGRIIVYGVFTRPVDGIDFFAVGEQKELTIYGSTGRAWTSKAAISLISSKRVKVTPMITHRFELDDLEEALQIAEKRREGYIKGLVLL